MEPFYLKELIPAINAKSVIGDTGILIKGVSIDSRTTKRGEVYFALQGNRYDGHDFINQAIQKGASSIVCSRNDINLGKSFTKVLSIIKTEDTLVALGKLAKTYRSKFKNIKILGITGSNGKTTTKEILTSILSLRGETISNEGNLNNRVGLPLSIFNLTKSAKYAVFEMGTSLRGEIEILSDIVKPDLGVITNIGFSHLETFLSTGGVFKEKRVLYENVKENGCAVINNDDEYLKTISNVGNRKIITFALDTDADVYAKNITLYQDKAVFDLFYKKIFVRVLMLQKGRFNIANALAAASCAIGLGFCLEEIKKGIEKFTPPKMRMETLTTSCGVVLINDAYNANPSSAKQAIQAVIESYCGKEINLVLGDMLELGSKSLDYHFELGKFISSQNVKSVNLYGKMSLAAKEALSAKNVFYSKDLDALLANLKQLPTGNNSVFLFKASRGMKLEDAYAAFYNILEKKRK
jgi:UDP-N-acetylmuramoyl-tripeptide--D-alanyl-D-alanine ligase